MSYEEEDTSMSYEVEDTCMSHLYLSLCLLRHQVMTESAIRTQRLEVAEGLIEELVSAHKDAETRAKKLEQQVFF